MKQNKSVKILLVVLIILTLISLGLSIFRPIKVSDDERIVNVVGRYISMFKVPSAHDGLDGKDGRTPLKGLDYADGQTGRDGAPGTDGKNGVDGTPGVSGRDGADGKDGEDGKTPQLRCNENKNRWEVRYGDDENWSVLNNKSTPCKATAILQ